MNDEGRPQIEFLIFDDVTLKLAGCRILGTLNRSKVAPWSRDVPKWRGTYLNTLAGRP